MGSDAGSHPADGIALYRRARSLIPGGTQLFSKRPELHLPGQWPGYYERAVGAEVWALDGSHYVDMSYAALGAILLGYADPDVDAAVKKCIDAGSITTLNCPEEVALAEVLVSLHPWASQVRYARTGGEAMAIAVRIARAATGRDKIAFCGYHGWHDWYLAANLDADDALDGHLLPGLSSAGVPRALRGSAWPFRYNHLNELEAIVSAQAGDLAAVVMEPVRSMQPEPGFLAGVRDVASRIGAVLIFDEVTTGWRLTHGGAHLLYNVMPDMAVFAKGMSNGYPMAAVIGTSAVMDAAQDSFISSTYWTDRIGPVAALATIEKLHRVAAQETLAQIGAAIQAGWRMLAERHGLLLRVGGLAPLGHFAFEYENAQAVRTLFTQLMLERDFLATSAFYAMWAHNAAHVEAYLDAVNDVFGVLAAALERDAVESMLHGPVAHQSFTRLA